MSIDNVVDTLLNLWVFVFIGIIVWLYFKPDPKEAENSERERTED